METGKYSFGIGDRFGQQGFAQLSAFTEALDEGIELTPVWNKSNREHQIIHSDPEDVRYEADSAVAKCNWKLPYFVDADHINLSNVDRFLSSCDYFTIDVAEQIGKKARLTEIEDFVKNNLKYCSQFRIPGIADKYDINPEWLEKFAQKFLLSIIEAAAIFRHIESKKGIGNFVAEISMDEVETSQSPAELFFILSSLGIMGIPVQAIAPKFTGRFNKGVDYEGDIELFRKEFEEDLFVLEFAVKESGLPGNLKLSIHSGSDKFSIFPVIGELIRKYDKGIHIKTAGTTWLEEMTGLALAGKDALDLAKSIYRKAYERRFELYGPYSNVININEQHLPNPSETDKWTGQQFAGALKHQPGNPAYNPSFRQLIHIGYKIAAEYSNVFINMLNQNKVIIGKQVKENILERHIRKLFVI